MVFVTGRFRSLNPRIELLPLERSVKPYYREYPPGVANEHVDLPIVFGMVDFLLYVVAIIPLAAANQSLFFLWVLTIPFGFLSTAMPVGPVSGWYWRKAHAARPAEDSYELESALLAKRQKLYELVAETVKVEAELTRELPKAGDLHFAFEAQIRLARQARERITKEMTLIDIQLANLRISRLNGL